MMELAAAKEVAHQLHRTSSSVQKHRRSRGRVVEECQQSKDAHEEDILRHERYVELLKVLKEARLLPTCEMPHALCVHGRSF